MPQQEKSIWNNQNLFSNNYLEHRLLSTSFLGDKEKGIEKVFEAAKNSYERSMALNLGPGEEASLEDKFIRPLLKILGYEWDVQPTTERGTKKRRPDYALFKDKPSLEGARKEKENITRFFSYPLTILEAKYWGRRLNDSDPKDTLDRRDPTAQTVKYLDDVYHATGGRIQWAMLTNGKNWRLFYYRAASRSGNFYEVDLEEIIRSNSLNNFKYFYLFFARDAFIPEPTTGKTWLDQHLKGSEDYATRVSENLKERIFDNIFESLATGFIEYRRTELGIKKETDENLKEIFNGCLTLLYRLLFLLYAESRALLPVNDQDRYYKKSLKKLKEDIAKDLETTGLEGMSHKAYDYWSRLESLCRIIDTGDKALNIPIYNGGLFETPPGSFLTMNKISDPFLAEAIELLTIDRDGEYTPGQKPFLDYSSLSVRHLGDIYEGLLEFHIQIADEPMVEVKEKGKFLWRRKSEIKADDKTCSILEKGNVYIENSKHERKATGSYYTPHYIVEYIVKNTVGTVLNERLEKARGILSELEALYEKQRRQLKKPKDWKYWEHPGEPKGSHIEEITKLEGYLFDVMFDIKVLDPAMGSGHFLVHTVDFITDRIITFLADYPENPVIRKIDKMKGEILEEITRQGVKIDETRLTEVNLIKRTVMKRCIYGVDLNEMAVELAKLSLWLDSFTLGAPLSFLDHHLKCGNSLIGTNLEALKNATKHTLIKVDMEPLNRAIRNMLFVSSLSDATYQQVKDSEQKYRDADKNIVGYRILLDILVAEYFGIDFGKGRYKELLLTNCSKMDFDKAEKSINLLDKFDKEKVFSVRTIAREKRFFHWQIEFPEVFFERVGALEQKVEKKENPGFDCVIGNPPWGALFDTNELEYLRHNYSGIIVRMVDSYMYFVKQAIELSKIRGLIGQIVPNPILTQVDIKKLREYLINATQIDCLLNLGDGVFGIELANPSCVFISKKIEDPKLTFDHEIRVSDLRELKPQEKEKIVITNGFNICKVKQTFYQNTHNYSLITKGFETTLLFRKLEKSSYPLKEFLSMEIQRGISSDYLEAFIVNEKNILEKKFESEICKPVITGHNVSRFGIEYFKENIFYLTRDDDIEKYPNVKKYLEIFQEEITCKEVRDGKHPWFALHRPRDLSIFKSPKLVGLTTSDRLVIGLDTDELFAMDNLYLIHLKDKDIRAFLWILSILNSSLLSYIYRFLAQEEGRILPQVKAENLYTLPICRISFVTPKKEREKEVGDAIAFYKALDQVNILKWAEQEITRKRNDTIHDLLAYLAEQMIEMNKEKNEEIKGFLKWLEREIGAEIDTLTNKTVLKEYHKHGFNQLLVVLKKNRNKISIDPSDRKKQEMLEKQFDHSMSILEPLKARIKATDELIDEIVYRLYGLTEEEIKVVKELA